MTDKKIAVWLGTMPESNGKTNHTVMLYPVGESIVMEGVTMYVTEYPDRARYEADRLRYLIGEIPNEPFILDYDADLHSGYVSERGSDYADLQWELDALKTIAKDTLRILGMANQNSSAYNKALLNLAHALKVPT